jgi:hypothetical protein
VSNYYRFRKNFGAGILAQEMISSPRYPDDPLYDELAVETDHTLPSTAVDGVSTSDIFLLVVWYDTVDPGDDSDMEIMSAIITSHPRVFQMVERGLEGTSVAAHPVGSNVGLHYTAGLSLEDLQPLIVIHDSTPGSLIYSWTDVFGVREIGILEPGLYGQVLVTAGDGHEPFWDWVWGSPGAAYGRIRTFRPRIYSGHSQELVTMNVTRQVTASGITAVKRDNLNDPSYFTEFDLENPRSFTEGSVLVEIETEILNFSGDSNSEQLRQEEAVIGSSLQVDIV